MLSFGWVYCWQDVEMLKLLLHKSNKLVGNWSNVENMLILSDCDSKYWWLADCGKDL